MEKIDRNTGLRSGDAITHVLVRRLLDKSDELMEEVKYLHYCIGEITDIVKRMSEWSIDKFGDENRRDK